METRHFILATAGHVDHGKSALVHALSGTDPDRLPDEKARGMTIDLGFAHLLLGACDIGIVDVPGHEDFVKNMVAGVGSIDAALLVVAADDGWMPQTEEHLQILEYLGVTRGVVALTKIDLVENEQQARVNLRRQLQASALANAPIVPTSVKTSRGIEDLKHALSQLFSTGIPQPDNGKPRLPVDRVFTVKGAGTVVTGTLTGGRLARGQQVILQPRRRTCRVRALQSYHSSVETAAPGARVAVNLADLDSGVARGDVLTALTGAEPATILDVSLTRSRRCQTAHPIKPGTPLWIHHGAAAIAGRIFPTGEHRLIPGQSLLARVLLDAPILSLIGDRFVIRDWSGQHTIAGGIVLDISPPRLSRSKTQISPQQAALLKQRSSAPLTAASYVLSQLSRDGFAEVQWLKYRFPHSGEELNAAIATLQNTQKLLCFDGLICDASAWTRLRQHLAEQICQYHADHPERAGLAVADLCRALIQKLPAHLRPMSRSIFHELLGSVCQSDFEQTGTTIRRRSHQPSLPARLQSSGARLRRILHESALEPPSRRELADDDLSIQALKFLVAGNEAIELSPEVVISASAYASAVKLVQQFIQTHGPATVSELKTHLHSSRRIVVPLLEKLDREHLTRRIGDRRVLADHRDSATPTALRRMISA